MGPHMHHLFLFLGFITLFLHISATNESTNKIQREQPLPLEYEDLGVSGVEEEDGDAGNIHTYQGVQGRAGIDFPVLRKIPRTSFSCRKMKTSGYYADLETGCQVFHLCEGHRKMSFLCPNGTIFRQSKLTCDWWFKVDCPSSEEFYESSAEQLQHDRSKYAHELPTVTTPIYVQGSQVFEKSSKERSNPQDNVTRRYENSEERVTTTPTGNGKIDVPEYITASKSRQNDRSSEASKVNFQIHQQLNKEDASSTRYYEESQEVAETGSFIIPRRQEVTSHEVKSTSHNNVQQNSQHVLNTKQSYQQTKQFQIEQPQQSGEQPQTYPTEAYSTQQSQAYSTLQSQTNPIHEFQTYPPQQSQTYPTRESQTNPTHQSQTYPIHESQTYPTQQSQTNSTQESQTYPTQQSQTYPTQESQTYPTQQSQTYPIHESQTYPTQQSQTYPIHEYQTYPTQQSHTNSTHESQAFSTQQSQIYLPENSQTYTQHQSQDSNNTQEPVTERYIIPVRRLELPTTTRRSSEVTTTFIPEGTTEQSSETTSFPGDFQSAGWEETSTPQVTEILEGSQSQWYSIPTTNAPFTTQEDLNHVSFFTAPDTTLLPPTVEPLRPLTERAARGFSASPRPRPGLGDVPLSASPQALHSLARYFAADNTTRREIEKEVPAAAMKLMETLMPQMQEVQQHTTESNQLNPDLRQLAQIFSKALADYLEDPDSFRQTLNSLRPTDAPLLQTNLVDDEKDEVLDYSDTVNTKRPRITTEIPETTTETWTPTTEYPVKNEVASIVNEILQEPTARKVPDNILVHEETQYRFNTPNDVHSLHDSHRYETTSILSTSTTTPSPSVSEYIPSSSTIYPITPETIPEIASDKFAFSVPKYIEIGYEKPQQQQQQQQNENINYFEPEPIKQSENLDRPSLEAILQHFAPHDLNSLAVFSVHTNPSPVSVSIHTNNPSPPPVSVAVHIPSQTNKNVHRVTVVTSSHSVVDTQQGTTYRPMISKLLFPVPSVAGSSLNKSFDLTETLLSENTASFPPSFRNAQSFIQASKERILKSWINEDKSVSQLLTETIPTTPAAPISEETITENIPTTEGKLDEHITEENVETGVQYVSTTENTKAVEFRTYLPENNNNQVPPSLSLDPDQLPLLDDIPTGTHVSDNNGQQLDSNNGQQLESERDNNRQQLVPQLDDIPTGRHVADSNRQQLDSNNGQHLESEGDNRRQQLVSELDIPTGRHIGESNRQQLDSNNKQQLESLSDNNEQELVPRRDELPPTGDKNTGQQLVLLLVKNGATTESAEDINKSKLLQALVEAGRNNSNETTEETVTTTEDESTTTTSNEITVTSIPLAVTSSHTKKSLEITTYRSAQHEKILEKVRESAEIHESLPLKPEALIQEAPGNLVEKLPPIAGNTTHSDSRAFNILKSLYSLASRWG